jgi:drug/metabolite transporter (DMT)-like permease
VAALFALCAAVSYGAGDFFGGLAARRVPVVRVALRTNAIGLAGLLVATVFVRAASVRGGDMLAGGLGGLAGCVGILLLYQGLALGAMSVVAPITAVLAALVPVAWGLATGERPGVVALAGIPIAIAAIGLLAREPASTAGDGRRARAVGLALGSGIGFGLFFIGLDAAGDGAGLWPVVAGRVTSVVALLVVSAFRRRPDRPARTAGPWRLLVACGLLDAGANALFLLATQRGLLTVVAVLVSLYPTSTVLLARWVLHERLSRPQLGGCALALVAVAMVAAG